jgi:hypothetical protein
MANFHSITFKEISQLKNDKATQELELNDPIKESMMTAEIYKVDKRIKKRSRYGKNKKGLRYISCFDFKDMSEKDIIDHLSEGWHPKNGYEFEIKKTYVKRKNILAGNIFYERYDTPSYCSPSSESYWSM